MQVLHAAKDYDFMKMTNSQVDTLLNIWPKETSVNDLGKE